MRDVSEENPLVDISHQNPIVNDEDNNIVSQVFI